MADEAAFTLGRPSRRDIIVGGMLAATAGVAYARAPRHKLASIGPKQLDATIPAQIGPWHYEGSSGIVLPPPDELARLLYDQQLARAYVSPTDPMVMVAMAYGSSQGGMLQVHRPEICYPASGFKLSDTRARGLLLANGKELPTRFFSAHSDTRTEQVLYWTRVGNALPTSWTSQRLAIMASNLRGDIPDGLLVRMSTAMPDPKQGLDTLDRFAKAMLAAAGPVGQRRLVGTDYA